MSIVYITYFIIAILTHMIRIAHDAFPGDSDDNESVGRFACVDRFRAHDQVQMLIAMSQKRSGNVMNPILSAGMAQDAYEQAVRDTHDSENVIPIDSIIFWDLMDKVDRDMTPGDRGVVVREEERAPAQELDPHEEYDLRRSRGRDRYNQKKRRKQGR